LKGKETGASWIDGEEERLREKGNDELTSAKEKPFD